MQAGNRCTQLSFADQSLSKAAVKCSCYMKSRSSAAVTNVSQRACRQLRWKLCHISLFQARVAIRMSMRLVDIRSCSLPCCLGTVQAIHARSGNPTTSATMTDVQAMQDPMHNEALCWDLPALLPDGRAENSAAASACCTAVVTSGVSTVPV